jgi:hypothetical protein
MKNARLHNKAEPSALDSVNVTPARFIGTDDPRHLRVLNALLAGPQRRESIDTIAGVSNGPDVVMTLRESGLEIPCERIATLDRDGKTRRPGVYRMTAGDRIKFHQWRAVCPRGAKIE